MHAYIIYVCVYIHTHTYIHTYICVYACVCVCIRVCVCVCIHIYECALRSLGFKLSGIFVCVSAIGSARARLGGKGAREVCVCAYTCVCVYITQREGGDVNGTHTHFLKQFLQENGE